MKTGFGTHRSTADLLRLTEGGGADVRLPGPADFILQLSTSGTAGSLMAFGHHDDSFADDDAAYPAVGFSLDLLLAPPWLTTRLWTTVPISRGNATSALSLDRPVVSPLSGTRGRDATTGMRHFRPFDIATSREDSGEWTLTSQPHLRLGEPNADGILLMMRPEGSWPWASLFIHFRSEPANGRPGMDLRADLDLMSFQGDAHS